MYVNKLMTPDEVATYLNVQPSTVGTMVRSGKIAGIKLGKEWRFELGDIQQYIKSRKTKIKKQPLTVTV